MSKKRKIESQLECIIHYEGFDFHSNLKEINENNEQRIRAAKQVREQLSGANFHQKQCKGIPDTIGRNHGIHMTPCYKKFTLILSSQSKETFTPKRLSGRQPISLESTSTWVYPDDCNFCLKIRIKHKGQVVLPRKITTFNATKTVKESAKIKDSSLYAEIGDLDLIAKEFKYHQVCYQNFTREYLSGDRLTDSTDAKNNENTTGNVNEEGKLDTVEKYVSDNILQRDGKAVSMDVLQKSYGIGMNDRRYRHKLKRKVKERFPHQLLFLTTKLNTAEIVVSAKNVSSYVLSDDKSCADEAAKCLGEDILRYCETLPQTPWPQMIDQLSSELPELVTLFMTELLKTERHSPSRSENIGRLIQSYSADLVHGGSRDDTITAKHFLLALGVHNITGLQLFLRCLFAQYDIL